MAKSRRLSATRLPVELIENGIEAEKREQQEFFDLAERFRTGTNPDAAKRLGDERGRMVFGGLCQKSSAGRIFRGRPAALDGSDA